MIISESELAKCDYRLDTSLHVTFVVLFYYVKLCTLRTFVEPK